MKKFDKILKILVIVTIILIIPIFAMELIETDNFIFNFIRDCLDYLFLFLGGLSAGMMMIKLLKDEHLI